MTRDSYLFIGFLLLFAAVNAALLATGAIAADWTGFGVILAAGLTLSLYSFLYKDNPLYKFVEHLFVGVAAAYVLGLVWYNTLLAEIVNSLILGEGKDRWSLLMPSLLGALMLTRLVPRISWLSRIAFAFVVGLGAGLTIPRYISSFILAQMEPSLRPITWSIEGLNLVIILVGVVVNNAIVLIDMANQLRADGMGRFDALVEAGMYRFRPILMTTFTTVVGLFPMAVGNAKMIGMPYAPLGRTMMGGLLASTVLTLVIVPLFYTFFDDLRMLFQRLLASALARPADVESVPASDAGSTP